MSQMLVSDQEVYWVGQFNSVLEVFLKPILVDMVMKI